MNANALHAGPVDDRLPKPASEAEVQERLAELAGVFAADGWEGIERPELHREALKQYVLGEIGFGEAMKVFSQHGHQ